MSIIEQVADAEAKALEIRREAQGKARDIVAQANARAQQTLKDSQELSKVLQQSAAAEAEKVGAVLVDQMREQDQKNIEAACRAARENFNQAINFILNEVLA